MRKKLLLSFLFFFVIAPSSYARPVSDDTFFRTEEKLEETAEGPKVATGDEMPGDRGNALAEEEAQKSMEKNSERHWYNLMTRFHASK